MRTGDDYVGFKFKPISKQLLSSLENSEIFFARPDRLNDPFDCRVNITQALESAIKRSSGSIRAQLERLRGANDFLAKVQADVENMGIFSMSSELQNSLMWAHYANNHRGVCLTYAFPESFFYDHSKDILGIDTVRYGDNPVSDWFASEAANLHSFDDFGKALIIRSLTAKATAWEYEKEVRIVRRAEGPHVVDRSYLKQVCFGLTTSNSDIDDVGNLLGRCGYRGSFCKMARALGTDFGARPVDL